ncbi:MAG: ATP-binding protein [bacterium]|nr:ATP-binding protein [bacterium]
MFIEFNVNNYKSFRDLTTFSMVASTPIKEFGDENIFLARFPESQRAGELPLLKSAAVYGANASGKSNLLKAIAFMKLFVINSSKNTQAFEEIPVSRFMLNDKNELEPSLFEIIFIHEDVRYRYGFEIDVSEVHNEWLFYSPKGKEAKLFVREKNNIELGSYFKEGKGLIDKTRDNALFLSVAAQFNGEISTKIMNWFLDLNIISGLDDAGYLDYTLARTDDPIFRDALFELLKIADLGIYGIVLQKNEAPNDESQDNILLSLHQKYDKKNKKRGDVAFNFDVESKGTQKIFAMAGPILDTLEEGKILFVDELDARFHPLMTKFIIQLFNSKEYNPNNAQLIFATHDTNLLSNKLFRRDQLWFTEKDRYGATDLYSLSDYKVRADASFAKDYILGKYGAIPFIGDPSELIGAMSGKEK